MNGVIRELAKQAVFFVDDDCGDLHVPNEFIEKFAQLIVEETIHAIIKGGHGHLNPSLISKSAKEHFGVK